MKKKGEEGFPVFLQIKLSILREMNKGERRKNKTVIK